MYRVLQTLLFAWVFFYVWGMYKCTSLYGCFCFEAVKFFIYFGRLPKGGKESRVGVFPFSNIIGIDPNNDLKAQDERWFCSPAHIADQLKGKFYEGRALRVEVCEEGRLVPAGLLSGEGSGYIIADPLSLSLWVPIMCSGTSSLWVDRWICWGTLVGLFRSFVADESTTLKHVLSVTTTKPHVLMKRLWVGFDWMFTFLAFGPRTSHRQC
jgi:hypothetical protein